MTLWQLIQEREEKLEMMGEDSREVRTSLKYVLTLLLIISEFNLGEGEKVLMD